MGAEARCHPCHSTAHCRHMKRQPSLCHRCTCRGHCHFDCHRHLCCHCRLHRHCRCCRPSPLLSAVAIAVAVNHPPSSLLHCHQPSTLPLPLPLPSAIAVSITVSHHSCHLRWPSPSPSPSAISESCCLGMARIVFNQLKQRMLTLFYFVWTVGSSLIKVRWLTRCRAAIANTSIGRQASRLEASEGSGWQQGGDSRVETWMTMGGVVLLCCWGISRWQMVFVMMCWMW